MHFPPKNIIKMNSVSFEVLKITQNGINVAYAVSNIRIANVFFFNFCVGEIAGKKSHEK